MVSRSNAVSLSLLLLMVVTLCACEGWVPRDTKSLLFERFQRSEVFGFIAGLGTTFAPFPDLIVMLKRRSHTGINVRLLRILAVFQLIWVYYGLLIHSRPVVGWNLIAVLINLVTIGAYRHFVKKEKQQLPQPAVSKP